MTRLRRCIVALVALLAVAVVAAAPGAAQEGGPEQAPGQEQSPDPAPPASEPDAVDASAIAIRSVDGSDPDAVVVDFVYFGPREDVVDVTIRENGEIVRASTPVLIAEEQDFAFVLALDVSGSMEANDAFNRMVDAARAFVANKAPSDQVAIVTFSTTAIVAQDLTDDADQLLATIDELGVGGGTAMYDALALATDVLDDTDAVPNIVLLTDGGDSDSRTTLERAQNLIDENGALLFTVGLATDELDEGAIEELAESTGGVATIVDDDEDLSDLYLDLQAQSRKQFRTTFRSESANEGANSLRITIGGATTEGNFQPGERLDSSFSVTYIEPEPRRGVEFLQAGWALWLALVLLVVSVIAVVFSVVTSLGAQRASLDRVLQPYSDGFVAPEDDDDTLVTSALLQRAVAATGNFAERRGFLTRVEDALEQANLPLRAGEALFFYLAAVALVSALGFLLGGNLGAGLVTMVLAIITPAAVLSYLGRRRRKEFDSQLPDMLNLLASTLRAGYSLMQGVEAAAEEVAEPMRRELGRVVTEARLGMPVEEALDSVVARMRSRDFEWAVMAIRIQREVGGNLAALLVTVADTMTERERLRRDVATLTAEGKVSAVVLGILPIGLGAAMYVINPDYIGSLLEDTFGLILLGLSGVLMLAGFAWMYKIIDIEV